MKHCYGSNSHVLRHNKHIHMQGLSQDFETGCPKLVIVEFLGVQILKGDHNILNIYRF